MSRTQFHSLRVAEVRRETDDAVSILFDVPEDLADEFRFVQGQHLTLRKEIDGQELRRNYSICSSVDDGQIRVAVRHLEGGRFSSYANESLQAGDQLDVMPPQGRFFTDLDESNEKSYLAIAAGSGITPIASILKTTLEQEPGSSFTLVFGNRAARTIMLRSDINRLKNRFPERLQVIHVLSQEDREVPLFNGRVTADKLAEMEGRLIDFGSFDEVFLCGPQAMIDELRPALAERFGFDPAHVHFELFGTKDMAARKETTSADAGPMRKVSIIADRKMIELEVPSAGNSILDAALAAGADLPFACKGGVCCTCRAKLVAGEVSMDVNYALEDHEVEAGFILTCQAHPTSDYVQVDYDVA
ncbi:MAG: phenylacetate-CoA oxygenase/reductase subunit PaaK [Xanthomonadales bacterium]|nr:phenylacetate-CoA oxygenase/reductase subunit PaaK [Xanthomonadales bacterium]